MAFNIGGNIKKLRAEKGVTQEQLADNKADNEDMRIYGTLNQYYSNALAKKAEKLLRQSIDLGHETTDAQLMYLLASLGRNQENIDYYEDLVKTDPDNSRNWHLISGINHLNKTRLTLVIVIRWLLRIQN